MENVWKCVCILDLQPYCERHLPMFSVSKMSNDTMENVFPFPGFLSVSVGVMLTPVAQDLAFLMTPSCQVFPP